MTLRILAACLGILWVSLWPDLPPIPSPWVLVPLTSILILCLKSRFGIVAAFALGLSWGVWAGHRLLDSQLASADEGGDFTVVGAIGSLPEQRTGFQRFHFLVDRNASRALGGKLPEPLPEKLLISWYGRAELEAGQRWQLHLRLKAPRGSVNQHGFDYQRWLLSQGFGATGYVRDSADNQLLGQANFPLLGFRADVAQWIATTLPDSQFVGPLTALAVGERSAMTDEQWTLFGATGTGHLMAISGLHVGLAALFGYWLGFVLRSIGGFAGPTPGWIFLLPGICSCFTAAAYAAVAGFALPTQRALVMILVLNISLALGGRAHAVLGLAWALLLVLILDPLAGFDLGLWLSFGAVASLLLYFRPRRAYGEKPGRLGKMKGFGRAQFVVFVGLLLPLLALGLPTSWLSPVANLVAIPLVSFGVVLPLLLAVLLHSVFPALAAPLLSLADTIFLWVWSYLEVIGETAPEPLWLPARASTNEWLTGAQFTFAALGLLLLFLPRGIPLRWLGLALLSPLLLPITPERPPLQLTVLDVGQGLAVAVHTPNHSLIYDVGVQVSERFDMATAVVLPHLRNQGFASLDHLIVSHGDSDHAGATEALLAEIKVARWHVGEALALSGEVLEGMAEPEFCDREQSWRWDDVEFQLIEPSRRPGRANNNQSCILLIRYRDQSILLPGDIEASVERQLLRDGLLPESLTVLLAPHHGSRSSSTAAFVERLRPEHVVYSAGYRSRYGHPHPLVTARYERIGAQGHNTAAAGQIDFVWNDGAMEIRYWRQEQRRYWFAKAEAH